MEKNRLIMRVVSTLFIGTLFLTSCVQGELYDLMDEDECAMNLQVPRKKLKQDFGGGVTTITFGGGSSSNQFPLPNTCGVCVAAYYASNKCSYGSTFESYYWQVIAAMYIIRPGYIPYADPLYTDEVELLTGKTYHSVNSLEDLYGKIHTQTGDAAKEYIIRGIDSSSGKSHYAILQKLDQKHNGKIVLNTFDPGSSSSVTLDKNNIQGYFY